MTREEAMRNIEEVANFLDNRGMSGAASSLIEAAKALMVTREPGPKTGLSSCQCGGRAEILGTVTVDHFKREQGWIVRCSQCGTRTDEHQTEEEAKKEWGRVMGNRETLQPWVRTADRVPTGKDTNERGQVLARHLDGVFWVETYVYISTYPDLCPYWMPIPPLPDHIADEGKKEADHA